jgi:hypothetical protein
MGTQNAGCYRQVVVFSGLYSGICMQNCFHFKVLNIRKLNFLYLYFYEPWFERDQHPADRYFLINKFYAIQDEEFFI